MKFTYDIPEIIVLNIVHLPKLLTNLSAYSATAKSAIIWQRNGCLPGVLFFCRLPIRFCALLPTHLPLILLMPDTYVSPPKINHGLLLRSDSLQNDIVHLFYAFYIPESVPPLPATLTVCRRCSVAINFSFGLTGEAISAEREYPILFSDLYK